MLRFMFLALESRLLCDCFSSKHMVEEMLSQFPGQALWDWQVSLLASWNTHFGESQPLGWKTSCSDCHVVRKLHLGILTVYMGRDDQPQPDILAISRQVLGMWGGKNKNKNHLRCGEGPRATAELRPPSALFRPASPLGHSAEAPALVGGEGWEALPLRSLPDFLTHETVCIRKWFPFSSLSLGGSVYTAMDYQRWITPLGLVVRYGFYKHTRTYFSKY